jgi:DNA-binding CsgD family transcriptional regulator
VSGIDGLYEYNSAADGFMKADALNQILDVEGRINFIEQDADDNLWFIAENESGLIHKNADNTYTKITTPFKQLSNNFVNAFEFLYPYSADHIFFGLENGFAHYSSKIEKSYNSNYSAFITKVEVNSLDSTIHLPFARNNNFEFPYTNNSFRFYYAANYYENSKELLFSYFIENYLDEWSEWSTDDYHDFNNLHENDYVLKLKAKNIYGVESEIATFEFTIQAPWYRSNIAYYVYIFLILIVALSAAYLIQKRVDKSKQKERLQHQQELKQREKEFQQQALLADKQIMKLKNDKLESEKIFLDKELANQTMSIIQKNKFLLKLNQELKRIQEVTSDSAVKTKMSILKKRIAKEIDNEKQNKIFESYFDEVHKQFFDRLKETYPQLSPKDLRLCAYIRMNISSKEIATLLNISDRGVEISRYRLRKKMELSREVNLSTFLSSI